MITLQTLTRIAAPIHRVFDLSLSIEVHALGNVHFGEQAVPLAGRTSGLLTLGDSVTWQARHFGIRQRLTSKITQYDRPHAFQDTMQRGAFAHMQHDHFFRALTPNLIEMRDMFRFAAPLPPFGWLAERLVLRRYMLALLEERNRVLKQVAESDAWQQYLLTPPPA